MNFLQILPNVDKPIVSETRGIFYSVYEEFLVLGSLLLQKAFYKLLTG